MYQISGLNVLDHLGAGNGGGSREEKRGERLHFYCLESGDWVERVDEDVFG
jgi:hypothetical protein